MRLTERARHGAIVVIFGAGFVSLLARSVSETAPLAEKWRRVRFFSKAGHEARILNSPYFAQDPAFARTLLRLDAAWPVERDVELLVSKAIQKDAAEDLRRRAAYLLAPRRIIPIPTEETGVVLRLAAPKP